jgi:hypothetical protein
MTTPKAALSGMRARLFVIALASAAIVSVAQGCGAENSLVDGDCAIGYAACGGVCADTSTDPEHCGGCNSACAPGVACVSGICGGSLDGAADGSLDGAADGSLDGATDGQVDGQEGDGGDACPPPPYVTAAACGACGIVCVAPNSACIIDGSGKPVCAPPCVAPLTECSGRCVDLSNDARNCGTCGKLCPSNICVASKCQGATPGDVVVIGHDYKDGFAGSSQARVLTNAVFIPTSNPLRILSYEQFGDAAVMANVKALIQSAAGGRVLNVSVAITPAALASATLDQRYDVVLVHDQSSGDAATLAGVGAGWAASLATFAQSGGVIVALDGAGGQGAMPSLLTAAQLLDVAGHQSIAAGSLVGIVAPADRIATLVVSPYGTFDRSVTLQSNEANGGNVVYVAAQFVGGVPGDPVVVHKVVP